MLKSNHKVAVFLFGLFVLMASSRVCGTFSIVAIDTTTHEIGVAAASCVPGGIISDICHVEPNVGGFIAQAFYIPANRDKGIELMRQNLSAMEILTELIMSDEAAPDRQYGIITIKGGNNCFYGTSLMMYGTFTNSTLEPDIQCSAFTGNNNPDWQGHIVGPNYTIQGNILAGEHIPLSMEEAFVNTDGPLAVKLMAALQGAKQVGADSRCDSTSSLCACIKVGRPTDSVDSLMLNINVTNVEGDPIDSLQAEFDRQYQPPGQSKSVEKSTAAQRIITYPNPFNASTRIEFDCQSTSFVTLEIYDILGKRVKTLIHEERQAGAYSALWNSKDEFGQDVPTGIYFAALKTGSFQSTRKLFLIK
jgi:uncharacterized Ntn-hydrolase superfamily protein